MADLNLPWLWREVARILKINKDYWVLSHQSSSIEKEKFNNNFFAVSETCE
jgi:hypothetical protein